MSRKLEDLLPEVQPLERTFVAECANQGIPVLIIQTFRTVQEQNELYAQGRTKPGKIVTNAKGGYSWHNFKRAFDAVPIDSKGQPSWNAPQSIWQKMGQIAKDCGLEWGGSWSGFLDLDHFQFTGGKTLAEERSAWGIVVA